MNFLHQQNRESVARLLRKAVELGVHGWHRVWIREMHHLDGYEQFCWCAWYGDVPVRCTLLTYPLVGPNLRIDVEAVAKPIVQVFLIQDFWANESNSGVAQHMRIEFNATK